MSSAIPKSFDNYTKITILMNKIDICKTANNFIAKKESRKEQCCLSQLWYCWH